MKPNKSNTSETLAIMILSRVYKLFIVLINAVRADVSSEDGKEPLLRVSVEILIVCD